MSLDLEEREEEDIEISSRSTDLSEEIFQWRKLLRKKEYLSQPMKNRTHSSTSGTVRIELM